MNQCYWCGLKDAVSCNQCSVYSCHLHLGFHRQNENCLPVEVVQKPIIGRCLIATRDISPGELIFQDESAAWGMKDSGNPQNLCFECLRPSKSVHTDCNVPLCEANRCQTSHLQKDECKMAGELIHDELVKYSAPLRLLRVLRNDKDMRVNLGLLMDHSEDEDCDEAWNPDLDQDGMMKRSIGLLKTNAVDLANGKGRALFPFFSFISHSCCYNSKHVIQPRSSPDSSWRIRVYSKIQILKGQEITITYINLLRPTYLRQDNLSTIWHFRCSCHRCQNLLSNDEEGIYIDGIRCPYCRSSILTRNLDQDAQVNQWSCEHCQKILSHQCVEGIVEKLHGLLDDTPKDDVEALEEFLNLTSSILHHHHYLVLITKRYLSQLTYNPGRKLELCHDLLEVFDRLDPGLSQSRGITLYEKAQALKQGADSGCDQELEMLLKESIACLESESSMSYGHKIRLKAISLLHDATGRGHNHATSP